MTKGGSAVSYNVDAHNIFGGVILDFWVRGSLCSFGAYPKTCSTDQADLVLTEVCPPLPP